jgi:hypothetical protein
MTNRRIPWAVNLPDGTPLLIVGAMGDVDDETGIVSLNERCREIIQEILEQNPEPTGARKVPTIDLAAEVHRLIQAKHAAGIPVRARLPRSDALSRTKKRDGEADAARD